MPIILDINPHIGRNQYMSKNKINIEKIQRIHIKKQKIKGKRIIKKYNDN
jgi:hypothetical protein